MRFTDEQHGAKLLATVAASKSRRARATAHPVLRGERKYLRALRAAEMAAWDANLPRELAEPFAAALAASNGSK